MLFRSQFAVNFLIDHLRLADGELVPFATHRFDEHREMQQSAAADGVAELPPLVVPVDDPREDAEQRDDGELLRDINTPESLMMSRQVGEAVNSAMDALGDDLKTAITLREIDGLSYEEIASAMNCPVGTVRSRIFRARDAIAARLKPLIDSGHNKRW